MAQLTGLHSLCLKQGDDAPGEQTTGHFRVYNMRFCPFAERAIIYLARKGIDAEVINIDLKEKPEWYFAKHPQGKVPALEHDGKTVIESLLIPEYLDDIFLETSVLPKDPYEKIQQKVLVEQIAPVQTSFYGLVGAVKDTSLKDEKMANVLKALADAEKLFHHDFLGVSPSFADYMVFPFFERVWWISHIEGLTNLDTKAFPGSAYPKIQKWFAAMLARPEVANNIMPVKSGLDFIASYITGTPDYNAGIEVAKL